MSDTSHDNPDTHDSGSSHKSGHGGHGAHGGGHEEGHEGAPEWLISFADMVMLMMGFFVILFALNNKPSGRSPGGQGQEDKVGNQVKVTDEMLDFAIGVREAFNNPVSINSTDPRDAALVRRIRQKAGKSETMAPGIKGNDSDVQSIRPSEYYALSGSIPFAEHSAELLTTSQPTITEIAGKVRGVRLIVEVKGHVSSVEAAKGPEVAMKLSTDRAMAVARALAKEGVAWWQVRLVGSADHDRREAHPSNRTADMTNSRVEVILTDQVVPDAVPTRYENAPASGSV